MFHFVWLVALFPGLLSAAPAAGPLSRIGYGSSTATISSLFQENVFLGFELGFQKVLGKERAERLLLVKQVNDKSLQGATRSAEELIAAGAVALVGFPDSHDALLAADVARRNDVLGIFGAAAHSGLSEKGPLVYSTGSSMASLVDTLLGFLRKTFGEKKGLAVINPYAVFSMNQQDLIKEKLRKYPGISLEVHHLTPALVLTDEDLRKIAGGQYEYLYLTLYPDDLVAVLSQLKAAKIDVPIVAWGGPDPDVLRRFVAEMKSPYYIGTTWIPDGSPQGKQLEKEMIKRVHRKPNQEVVIGYDLGLVVGELVSRVKGPLTRKSIIEAFEKDRCFDSLKSKVCFGPDGGHARRAVEFVRFTRSGLESSKL